MWIVRVWDLTVVDGWVDSEFLVVMAVLFCVCFT